MSHQYIYLLSNILLQWRFPKMVGKMNEFSNVRESDKSLKHELESI